MRIVLRKCLILIRELLEQYMWERALEISRDLWDSDILVPVNSCPSHDVTNKPKLLLKSTSSLSLMDVTSKTLPPRHVAPVNCYLNHLPFTVKARCHSPVRFINSTTYSRRWPLLPLILNTNSRTSVCITCELVSCPTSLSFREQRNIAMFHLEVVVEAPAQLLGHLLRRTSATHLRW